MASSRRTVSATVGVVGVAGALALSPVALGQGSANTVQLANGDTSLHLNAATAGVLSANGVSVAPIGRADASGTRVDFPITGGSIVPNTGAGTYAHQGSGLRLSAPGARVDLRNLAVNSRTGRVSAQVGGSRVDILDLDTSDAVVIRRGPGRVGTWIVRVQADLSGAAAAALNNAFDTDVFAAGVNLGRVDVKSSPAQVILNGGSTLLAPSDTVLGALTALGLSFGNVPPAAANTAGALNFPIDGQKVTLRGPSGRVDHRGGLTISDDGTTVALTNFTINLGSRSDATALVDGANRTPILDLDLSDSRVGLSLQQLVVTDVEASLAAPAAAGLNRDFNVNVFQEGFEMGVARVQAQVR